jgi:hypothetical protein
MRGIGVQPCALDPARDLAEFGFDPFACRQDSKAPLRGSHGFKDATRDERALLHLFADHPERNLAIACGAGVAVVDIEDEHPDPMSVLCEHGLQDAPMIALTRSWGLHCYCAGPCRTGPTAIPHVEIRGRGAYVVCPPSTVGGRRYHWLAGPVHLRLLPALPEALRPVAAPAWTVQPTASGVSIDGEALTVGNRHAGLKALAIALVHRGLGEGEVLAGLLRANATRCQPPKSDAEVAFIARWALRSDHARAEAAWLEAIGG